MANFRLNFVMSNGQEAGIDVSEQGYQIAANRNQTFRQYVNGLAREEARAQKSSVNTNLGEAFDQAVVMSGLMPDLTLGESPMTWQQMTNAALDTSGRAPDGNDTSVASTLLYPQLILEALVMNKDVVDGGFLSKYSQMIGYDRTVTSARADQPVIDYKGPEDAVAQEIAQEAAPVDMLKIRVSDQTYRIPTRSIGLEVSQEAMQATTLDFVSIIIQRQATGQRIRTAQEQLSTMINGNPNYGIRPLPVHKISEFDPSITENGKITKKAYLKMLRAKRFEWNMSRGALSLDTALTLDDTFTGLIKQGPDAHTMKVPFNGIDLDIDAPTFLDLDDEILGGPNRMLLLDPKYAIQRMTNISASYQAVQEFVLRRSHGFRVDHGEAAYRMYDDAWTVVDLRA